MPINHRNQFNTPCFHFSVGNWSLSMPMCSKHWWKNNYKNDKNMYAVTEVWGLLHITQYKQNCVNEWGKKKQWIDETSIRFSNHTGQIGSAIENGECKLKYPIITLVL